MDQIAPSETPETESESLKPILKKDTESISLVLKLSSDRLRLFLDCARREGEKRERIGRQTLISLIEETIAPDQLNLAVLDAIVELVNQGKRVENRRIAQGVPPVHGQDGRVDFAVRKITLPGEAGGAQTKDTRFVRLLKNIEAGAQIGKLLPPVPGKDGADVFGGVIKPKEGKPLSVVCDQTIVLKQGEDPSEQVLIAEKSGFLTEKKGKLTIADELVIQGDVDIDTGNIDFIGTITVLGDVAKDYNLTARGDIHIQGSVHGGVIVSHLGAVTVKAFVVGGRGYYISTGTTFTASMVQSLFVTSDGDIIIDKEARDSTLRTKGKVLMSSGHLFGGVVTTPVGIEAAKIGAIGGARTSIICSSKVTMSPEETELREQIAGTERALAKLRETLGHFADHQEAIEKLASDARAKFEPINEKLKQVEASRLALEEQLNALKAKEEQEQVPFRVNYLEKLFQGVTIDVNGIQYIVDQDMDGPGTIEFDFRERKFVARELKSFQQKNPEKKSG